MNRLAKKCVIGSATLHGSLIGVVLICSAFVGSDHLKPEPPPIELVPFGGNFRVTDGPSHGGGTPPPVVQPKPAAEQPQAVVPPPPKAAAQPREEKTEPTPKKVEPRVVEPKPPKDDGDEPVRWKPRTPKVSLTPVVRNSKTKPIKVKTHSTDSEDGSSEATERANKFAKNIASNINGIAGAITRATAQTVISDSYGDGSGGVASVNYNTVLFTRYYNAWISPDEVDDPNVTTDVRVTIAHDGTVISSVVERRSGNSAMDRSVERALRTVRKLEPFPPAWRESERTFRIRFNLKSKLAIG